jgi:hypothetical protein
MILGVMANVIRPPVVCPTAFGCTWADRLKHRPHPGLVKSHTINGNAKYRPGMTPAMIQAVETATVAAPTRVLTPPPTAEYVRDVRDVIGYVDGEEVTLSYVECTSRVFHGRPIAPDDPKLRGGP